MCVQEMVGKYAGREDQIVGDGNDLGGSVQGIGSIGEGNTIYDLLNKCFNWLVEIIFGFHLGVVGLKVGGAY